MLKDLTQSKSTDYEVSDDEVMMRVSTASKAILIINIVLFLLLILSLILTAVSASKLNSNIISGTDPFKKMSFPKRDSLVKLGSASQFLWWMPGINIILASIFTHKTFNSGLL